LLFEKGVLLSEYACVLLFEKEVLLFEKGVLLFEKGVLLFEKGVLLFEKGVLLFEKHGYAVACLRHNHSTWVVMPLTVFAITIQVEWLCR
jgi:hypothetical protein